MCRTTCIRLDYHCDPRQPLPFATLGSQKNYMSLYLMCVYGSAEHSQWFQQAWAKTGKKLDMGKSCVRFKKLEDLALDVIGAAIRRVPAKKYIEHCEAATQVDEGFGRRRRPARGASRQNQQGKGRQVAVTRRRQRQTGRQGIRKGPACRAVTLLAVRCYKLAEQTIRRIALTNLRICLASPLCKVAARPRQDPTGRDLRSRTRHFQRSSLPGRPPPPSPETSLLRTATSRHFVRRSSRRIVIGRSRFNTVSEAA